ncbi:YeeE/YedE family protein [Photobacterium sanguinicancri]|uniref:YeeE/YedE family protein n=1 Tax=Photobacterium sanguinicancri TaxID=875932 RepID=UPI0026E42DEC|nr:YeeE/YedE family protein [Photobacterium sanguinicancri]MDO6496507.1 YeeE/YedE family protein [Photobacterium sanguinicancri]
MNEFPWDALRGGMLLGLSAALLLVMNGRIAGISGILSGLLKPQKGEFGWRVTFIIGMVVASLIAPMLGFELPLDLPVASIPMVVLAGLLVGIGTKFGNGCTSGHGICGMGRLSKRSIIATCVFMGSAIVTTFIRLHL